MSARPGVAARPAPLSQNPIRRVASDLRAEWSGRGRFPPGPTNFSMRRMRDFMRDPLPILLGCYERYGPIFSLRLFHERFVFMLGPEANNFVLVEHPEHFHWREGDFGQLIPLLGDGLLTIDEDYHDRARGIMMPAFHREQIEATVATMRDEAERALDRLRAGEVADVYHWMRELAMRIAMRALLGLDPDDEGSGARAAHHFERALAYYSTDAPARMARGPFSPWRRMQASRRVLDEIVYGEIARRRGVGESGRRDVLSLLIEARDENGDRLADVEIRDQVMTLLFAGHDTSTSTVSFLLYELARNPDVVAELRAERERVLGDGDPEPADLHGGLPYLDMVLDETLRLYPPAWIGPRRSTGAFEFAGQPVPADTYVAYCSWASHRLPEVFPEPEAFRPERFTRERKAALPRGAYVPFGGGKRICIGKRFGQTEVKLVATMLLRSLTPELAPGHRLEIRQMPTIGPEGGLPLRLAAA